MATNEEAAAREPESAAPEKNAPPREESSEPSSPLRDLGAMGRAAKRLFGNWRALLLILVLYAALVASLYFFIAIREASFWQVMATFLLAALVPVLFFILQAIGTRYVEREVKTRELLRWSVSHFWRLLVVTLPVLLLVWLLVYLFGKFQPGVPAAVSDAGGAAGAVAAARPAAARNATEVFSWKEVLHTTLKFLILGLVLPLLTIHLWIAAARHGLGGVLRNLKRVLARALAPGAVLIYALGLLLFGVIPYFLITTNYSRGGAWTELSLLGGRLLLASLFMLFGWLLTLGALSMTMPELAEAPVKVKDEDAVAE